MTFKGFPSDFNHSSSIPEVFFSELLPEINSSGELKVLLYAFWYLGKIEQHPAFITHQQFSDDKKFMAGLAKDNTEAIRILKESLESCIKRQTLLVAYPAEKRIDEGIFFINNLKGRAVVLAIEKQRWKPDMKAHIEVTLDMLRPTVFQLYEQNIGPLTPMIAEDLKDAETLFPVEWLEDAIHIAVQNNVRRWKYVESILKSWKEKGRNEADKRDRQQDRGKYIQGEYGDIIKH
jgi:DNA replication protein